MVITAPFPNEEPEATCSGPRSWYVGCRDLSPAVRPQACAALGPGGAAEGGVPRVGCVLAQASSSQSSNPPRSQAP